MPLSNSFVKRVGKEDRYRKGWHPLIIGGLTILLSIFRAYQISDTPFLLLYHCSLNLDSLIDCSILCMKIFFATQNPRFSVSKSLLPSKLRYGKRYKKKEEDVPSRIMIHPPLSYTFYVSSTGEEYNSDKILKLSWVRKQKGISRRGF